MIDEPEWVQTARDMIGLREIKGIVNEPLIVRLWSLAGMPEVRDDETAWCAAFVGGVLETCYIRCTRKPNARSYEMWGVDVLESGPLAIPIGSIVVLKRPPSEWMGHVGFAVGKTKAGHLCILGGNQKDRVGVDTFDPERVIAARWPSEHRDDLRLLRPLPLLDIKGPLNTREA